MYNRQILNKTIIKTNEGSSSNETFGLPSVLKIISYIPGISQTSTVNTDLYDPIANKYVSASYTDSVIGSTAQEFAVDFYINSSYTDNTGNSSLNKALSNVNNYRIGQLYELLSNSSYISIPLSFFQNNFYIIPIDDYSYQAMTTKNYDYFVKIFYNNTSDNTKYKICNLFVAVLKSYTFKKAWILIDKCAVLKNNVNTHIVPTNISDVTIFIDFIYKFFNDTSSSNDISRLHFKTYNNYSNLQDLFNDPINKSPYYDSYRISNNGKTLLNQQHDYFDWQLNNYQTNNMSFVNIPVAPNKTSLLLRDATNNAINATLVKYRHILYTANEINYLSRECYEYDSATYKCSRVLSNTWHNEENTYLEIYPVSNELAHYIFKINMANDNISINDITTDIIHRKLKEYHIYLYNYDFGNSFNIIKHNSDYYLELYIPIPYDGYSNRIIPADITVDSSGIILSTDLGFTFDDTKHPSDPTFLNETAYTDGYSYIVPYISADLYVSDILQAGMPRIKYASNQLLSDIRAGNIVGVNFDIKADNDPDDIVTPTSLINQTDYFNAGYRGTAINIANNSVAATAVSELSALETFNNTLCTNLYNFYNHCASSVLNSYSLSVANNATLTISTIGQQDFFFYYIESSAATLSATITDDAARESRIEKIYPTAVKNTNTYVYIFPWSPQYSTISIKNISNQFTQIKKVR